MDAINDPEVDGPALGIGFTVAALPSFVVETRGWETAFEVCWPSLPASCPVALPIALPRLVPAEDERACVNADSAAACAAAFLLMARIKQDSAKKATITRIRTPHLTRL